MHRSQASEYNTETTETFFQNLNQFDNVTKNIIREIIRECALNKVRISEELATYYVSITPHVLDQLIPGKQGQIPIRPEPEKFIIQLFATKQNSTKFRKILRYSGHIWPYSKESGR